MLRFFLFFMVLSAPAGARPAVPIPLGMGTKGAVSTPAAAAAQVAVSTPAAAAAQVAVSTPGATVAQLYPGLGRDPLVPSTVFGGQAGLDQAQSSPVTVSSFSINNLSLTGIMEDSGGKQALLADIVNGKVYTLKAGRLLDSKKKPVPGVSGVIKGKQIILLTNDKKIRQIDLREKKQTLEN
ncbi:MAG: hypothetical protein NTX59_01405 [Elusimicrobia bacterium]|nr:hypothetical protein [Elusimicrobiota bacterium]